MSEEQAPPGQWVRRVGLREPAPRMPTAAVSTRRVKQRRPGAGAWTPDREAARLAARSGSRVGEWARRIATRESVEVERAARVRAASDFAGETEAERTEGVETAGERQVVSAPVKRRAERIAASAEPLRANVAEDVRAQGRTPPRFGNSREEQRARVEGAR